MTTSTGRVFPVHAEDSRSTGHGETSTGRVHERLAPSAPAVHAGHMALVDGCPECVSNTEPPQSVETVRNAVHAAYQCSDCGHAWTTDWRDA